MRFGFNDSHVNTVEWYVFVKHTEPEPSFKEPLGCFGDHIFVNQAFFDRFKQVAVRNAAIEGTAVIYGKRGAFCGALCYAMMLMDIADSAAVTDDVSTEMKLTVQ